ncbi:Uncharacterised protein [Candidatus Burarchaeum australiense]|nr:Uncharacterised protein [Candidatus Burarchaeum australiense]
MFLFLFGCLGGGSGNGTQPGQTPAGQGGPQASGGGNAGLGTATYNETPKGLVVKDAEMKSIYEAALKPEPPETSLDKIQEAYDSQKISKEDYIVLSLQASFDPTSVPAEYAGAAGPELGSYHASRDVMLAVANWDSLSDASKNKIKGWIFLTPEEVQAESDGGTSVETPAEPSAETSVEPTVETPVEQPYDEGYTEPPVEETAGARHLRVLSLAGPYPPGPGQVLYTLDAIPGKAVVKGFLPAGHSQADKDLLYAKMKLVRAGVVDSWDKFRNLLGVEPSETVYLYVQKVPSTLFGTMALTQESSDPVLRCRAKLNAEYLQISGEKYAKAGVAHELFHCFQYYIPLRNYNDPNEAWLMEATATWSEHFIYPTYNSEQEYLPLFYQTRNKPLVFPLPRLKKYADYNFFLYLQESGSSGEVAKVLLDAKTVGAKGALNALPDFQNGHADFSFWNWNKAPFQFYSDDPKYPDVSVSGPAVKYYQLTDASSGTTAVSLDAGTATYQVYDVMVGPEVKKLDFKFQDINDEVHQRHALLRIDGQWIDEQWTGLKERRFCLDRPGEKVEAVVLIYSNADLNAPFFSQYEVDTKGECPLEITGTTTIENSISAPLQGGEFRVESKFVSRDVLQYDETEDAYKLKSRSVTCKTSSNAQGSGMDTYLGAPYLAGLEAKGDCSGAATIQYNDLGSAPVKIEFYRKDNVVSVDLDPSVPEAYSRWIRCSTFQKMSWDSTALIIKQLEYSGTCGIAGLPSRVDWNNLNIDEVKSGNRLHKEESQSMPVEGGTASMKISIDYILSEQP